MNTEVLARRMGGRYAIAGTPPDSFYALKEVGDSWLASSRPSLSGSHVVCTLRGRSGMHPRVGVRTPAFRDAFAHFIVNGVLHPMVYSHFTGMAD